MAIDLLTRYAGRINPATGGYPFGSIKNKTAGVDDGTPLDDAWGNDIEALLQSLLSAVGDTPNNVVDQVGASQYFDALVALGLRAATTALRGVVELATSAEVQAGTDGTRAVTAATLASLTASVTRAGLVELATNAEAQAGTDTERALTVAALVSRTATTTRTGLIELATAAEAQGYSDGSRALTAGALNAGLQGINQSLGTNGGYQRLPGGLVLQMGVTGVVSAGADVTVTFPMAFPNFCTSVVITRFDGSNPAEALTPHLKSKTATQAVLRNGSTTAWQMTWFAVGK